MDSAALAIDTTDLPPSVLVIFGITGDLAKRKVLPALYHLFELGILPDHTYLVGTSRQQVTDDQILDHIRQAVTEAGGTINEDVLARLHSRFTMLQLNPIEVADYHRLAEHLQAIEDQAGVCLQRLFYLSIPPQVYGGIVQRLGASGLNGGCRHEGTASRLLVEKPFGYDLRSAEELITTTAEHFQETQVFRIDHYLAKETAQNILTFRRHNPLFNQIWNHRHITGISITAAEQIGIEGRANFYEHVGALRDLIQSHLLQLLSLTIMELPPTLSAEAVHAAKQAVLASIQPMPADHVAQRTVRGQYDMYRHEVGNPDSTTETFAALVLTSTAPDWQNVPLRLTTGKALRLKRTSITVDFGSGDTKNRLQFRIQPDEGITLTLQVKKPGFAADIEPTAMDFTYQTAFAGTNTPDAYERVLLEAIRGDHLLFATSQEVLTSWRILQPILDEWAKTATDLQPYATGSDGPNVQRLLDQNGS